MAERKKKVLSFAELETADDRKFDTVEAFGGTVRLASLSAFDMLAWVEENDDKEKAKLAGFRMLVKALVDEDGNGLPADQHDSMIEKLRRKDASDCKKLIERALRLNGIGVGKAESVKNDSGEAGSGASPAASPSPSAE
jgi:hypothetical protein